MRPEFTSYVAIGAIAAVVTCAVVPVSIYASRVRGLMVEPDARRMHERPTATLGGGAMYVGFVVAFLAASLTGWFDESFLGSTEPWAVLACATMAYLVGLVDDVKELSPPAKIAGMLVASGLLAVGGVSIIWFRIPFLDVFVLPYDLAFVATVIWVLGMANAVNFIDGLDGLAAGIVGIGALGFLLYGFRLGQVDLLLPGNVGPLIAAIVVGVCVGFLPWNVYPARVFMGDGGSLLLGSLMAASTMAVGGRTPDAFSGQTFFFYAPLAIPLVILGVPMLDTAFAILRRARNGTGLATADKDHLHHRLVRLGHGHRRSVWILWAWTALLSAFVLYPTYNDGRGDGIVPMGVGAAALVLLTLFKPGFRLLPSIGALVTSPADAPSEAAPAPQALHSRAADAVQNGATPRPVPVATSPVAPRAPTARPAMPVPPAGSRRRSPVPSGAPSSASHPVADGERSLSRRR